LAYQNFQLLLYNLLKIRIADEILASIYESDQIKCPIHLSTGSEAVSVGVCSALDKLDFVIGGHRSHGIYLAKNGSLNQFMSELFGKANGCSGGRGGSMHLISPENRFLGTTPILGATIPIGVGSAFASKLTSDKSVTAIFFGDGATDEGVFYESLNLAALYELPVLFICENNGYSIFQKSMQRTKLDNISARGQSFGVPGICVDGNNVLSVLNATSEILPTVRSGKPFLLECKTNRWRQHVGAKYDYEIGFGDRIELEKLIENNDPIERFTSHLISHKLMEESEINQIKKQVQLEVEESIEHAKNSDFPEILTINDSVYQ
jgi:TPP-dependent pyruvate/acetoin dehydrogenase alpha subunit